MLKTLLKSLLARTPYRLVRGLPNRFDAIEACLNHLKQLGYYPRVILDGGAHVGAFSIAASRVFPDAQIHMIEPQPACRAALEALARQRRFIFHDCALTSGPETNLRMWVGTAPSTGASIAAQDAPNEQTVAVRAATLDQLFSTHLSRQHRALLKLDLQGYELVALRGGIAIMDTIEVVQIEVSFFRQDYEPTIAAIIDFFDQNSFEFFDIAALSGRRRDGRLKQGDLIFVRRDSLLLADSNWH